MSMVCQGITLSGKQCNRKSRHGYCYQHCQGPMPKGRYRQTKPEDCVVCCESLANQRRALVCGHWIHKKCIIDSAKAECPICRTRLILDTRAMKRIAKLAKKREAEYIQEDEEELRMDLQYQVAGLIAPALRDRIQEAVGNLLDDVDDIDATDVLTDILDDEAYQSFLHSLMGFELLESDYNDSDDTIDLDDSTDDGDNY